jgi:hypothetical protein
MQLQVRSAYVKSDFEWDNLKKLSFKVIIIFSIIYLWASNKMVNKL